MNLGTLGRLRALAREPERTAMPRTAGQWPTMAAHNIQREQEIATLRAALAEAVAIIDMLQAEKRQRRSGA